MTKSTDLSPAQTRDKAQPAEISRVLDAVAAHLMVVRPTERLDVSALTVAVGARAYDVCGRRIGGQSTRLSAAVMAVAPEVGGGVTRGEYALRLRRVVAGSDSDTEREYQWPEGDNDPAIPRVVIPGQRRDAQQLVAAGPAVA